MSAHPEASIPAPSMPVDPALRRDYIGSLGISVVTGIDFDRSRAVSLREAARRAREQS
jgi:hypothetical protein